MGVPTYDLDLLTIDAFHWRYDSDEKQERETEKHENIRRQG